MNAYSIDEILNETNGTLWKSVEPLWKSMKLARQRWISYGDQWHCYGNVPTHESRKESTISERKYVKS